MLSEIRDLLANTSESPFIWTSQLWSLLTDSYISNSQEHIDIVAPYVWAHLPKDFSCKVYDVSNLRSLGRLLPYPIFKFEPLHYNPSIFAEEPYLQLVKSLDVSLENIGNGTFSWLLQLYSLISLQELQARGNQITGVGLEKTIPLPHLRKIDFSKNKISDFGLQSLLEAPFLKAVEELDLSSNQITDKGLLGLKSNFKLHNLKYLNIRDNPTKSNILETLRKNEFFSTIKVIDCD